MKKLYIPSIILILLISIVLVVFSKPEIQAYYLTLKYDFFNDNNAVESKEEIEAILNDFNVISFEKLSNPYLKWTKSNQSKYQKMLKDSEFTLIKRKDFFRKIVGNFRIKDFVSRDSIYQSCLYNPDEVFYWLIDKKLLFAVLEIQQSLEAKGYNKNNFWLRYGHRHPKLNEEAEAAERSKHIKGQAVDMVIGDINGDGKYTAKDKEIVLDIAENEVIKDKGGIGRYPDTQTIHIDVRGKRARWNKYTNTKK